MTEQRHIAFSPPDIGQAELDEVADALRSGWITTGPKTKEFERALAAFTGAERVACFNSATAALECALRALGIGPGDEVITSAYTYTASASPICHVGATPVLADVAPGSYEMDYDALPGLVTERTRAIVPVDIGGRMCDYDRLFGVLDGLRGRWQPQNDRQRCFTRIPVVADGAHSLGAVYHGRPSGTVADLTTFSFHAVKNLTTAEGGTLAWRAVPGMDPDELYRDLMLMSLHGQTKDALSKTRAGAWEYDVAFPGWKCNMTDLQAALGLAQLKRYPALLARRRELVGLYEAGLAGLDVDVMGHYSDGEGAHGRGSAAGKGGGTAPDARATTARAHADGDAAHTHADSETARMPADGDAAHTPADSGFASSGHLMLVRLVGKSAAFRNALIERLGEAGVAANVHYKPLPMLTAYRNLGFDIAGFPNARAQFENEVTLPLHTLLTDDDVAYVCEALRRAYSELEAEGVA